MNKHVIQRVVNTFNALRGNPNLPATVSDEVRAILVVAVTIEEATAQLDVPDLRGVEGGLDDVRRAIIDNA